MVAGRPAPSACTPPSRSSTVKRRLTFGPRPGLKDRRAEAALSWGWTWAFASAPGRDLVTR